MAYTQENTTQMEQVLELLMAHGFGGMAEAMGTLMNAAMVLERQRHLGVGYYERSPERQGQSNGFKPKTVKTRVGEVQLQIPQVRDSNFYPQSLECQFAPESGHWSCSIIRPPKLQHNQAT